MNRRDVLVRVLWCESATLAIVLTGDIPLPLAIVVMTLIPVLGLLPLESRFARKARRASSLLAGAYLLFFPIDWLYLSGRLIFATVHLMFYLKLHTLLHQRSERERARLHLICVFEMLAAASMTVDASFLGPLVVFVLLGTLVFLLELVRPDRLEGRELRAAVSTTFAVALPVLALAGAIFVALPRTSSGGFRLGGMTGITTTGFSERVHLGDFEEIVRSPEVVMRVVANAASSPPRWRGPAYDRYEDGEWRQSLSGVSSLPEASDGGFLLSSRTDDPVTRTEVFLEPLDTDVLFLPPASARIASNDRYVFIDPYWTLRSGRSARAGRHYVVDWYSSRSVESSSIGSGAGVARLNRRRRQLYTQLPALSERFHELARELAEASTSAKPLALARSLESYLESNYRYTLEQPDRGRGDPVEDFLFGARAGHCEYFATAMVLLLRDRGVPARLVTGFNRGERNAVGNFEVVRRTNAHAWVEVFQGPTGWVAFDPTPPAASATVLTGEGLLSQGIDSLRMLWDMYVVAFDVERQRGVLGGASAIGRRARASLRTLVAWALARTRLLAGMSVAALLLFLLSRTSLALGLRFRLPAWRWRGRSGRGAGPAFYETLTRRLARLGIERKPEETPAEFAAAWEEHLPGMTELTEIYYRSRFGGEVLETADRRRAERLASAICLAALGDGGRVV